jgi:hypothetical protein
MQIYQICISYYSYLYLIFLNINIFIFIFKNIILNFFAYKLSKYNAVINYLYNNNSKLFLSNLGNYLSNNLNNTYLKILFFSSKIFKYVLFKLLENKFKNFTRKIIKFILLKKN